jgi:iron-sulfur cluster repair protein YtfE (RIC family)
MNQIKNMNKEDWKNHKNYEKSKAKAFINIHNYFKTEMKEIQELCESKEIKKAKKRFESLKNSLDLHHLTEEEQLFPKLIKINKKLSLKLYEDHEIMNQILDELTELFLESSNEDFKINIFELSKKTKEFKEHMMQHLDDEEAITIPLILLNNFKFSCCISSSSKTCCYKM